MRRLNWKEGELAYTVPIPIQRYRLLDSDRHVLLSPAELAALQVNQQ
jgi:hypothetical protein